MRVDPRPETKAALCELSLLGDTALVSDLRTLTDRARSLVPEPVGVSIAALREVHGAAPTLRTSTRCTTSTADHAFGRWNQNRVGRGNCAEE